MSIYFVGNWFSDFFINNPPSRMDYWKVIGKHYRTYWIYWMTMRTQDKSKFPLKTHSRPSPPLSLFPAVQVFHNIMCEEIRRLPHNSLSGRNISFSEKLAIDSLKNNKTFTIKEADKGGNVVLWPIQLYLQEAHRQLNNCIYYHILPSDPTEIFQNWIGF